MPEEAEEATAEDPAHAQVEAEAKAPEESETGAGDPAESEAREKSEAETPAEPEAESETPEEPETKAEPEAPEESESEAETPAEIEAAAETEAEAETPDEPEAEIPAETKASAEPEAPPALGEEVAGEGLAQAETEAQAEPAEESGSSERAGVALRVEIPARAAELEPEDEVPPEYLVGPGVPATTAGWDPEQWEPGPGRIVVRVLAYTAALSWPFVGTFFAYKTLSAPGVNSVECSDSGCVPAATEFVDRVLPWLVPLSAASALAVFAVGKAVRKSRERTRARERVLEPEDEQPPVPRIVLAGMFVGVCALAFVVGVLRGVMINQLGR